VDASRIKNKSFDGLDVQHRGTLGPSPWSLCVGAGVSFGLVPTWQELTRRVVNDAFGTKYDDRQFQDVVQQTRWSLDALLQGAANKLSLDAKPQTAFADLLEKCLYEDLLNAVDAAGLRTTLANALNNPRGLRKAEVNNLAGYFETAHPTSSLVQLSRALAKSRDLNKGPRAVINFNADTLLFALLDLFLIREHAKRVGKWEMPSFAFIKGFRGIDGFGPNATPIFHCHGAVSPNPTGRKSKSKRLDAREHLVFTEADYLTIAGTVGTWAQALFLFHAQSSRLLIIGHSLADPNIRKWLSWSLSSSLAELAAVTKSKEFTPRHIWITARHNDVELMKIQEISLLHLGVRICWIGSWSDIGAVLDNLLAM
jgi:hypothetical protein